MAMAFALQLTVFLISAMRETPRAVTPSILRSRWIIGFLFCKWSITRNDAPPVPEPSSFILALAVGALLVLNRMRPATRNHITKINLD